MTGINEDAFRFLKECLGHEFANPELLLEALTHPSYAAERKLSPPDNQRLEFLGDAVLGFVVAEFLYERFPEKDEGWLTKVRSILTHDRALAGFAREFRLGEALLLGRGEDLSGGRERISNLEDGFEAVLGALFLDGGIEEVRRVCRKLAEEAVLDVETLVSEENPKGALQEFTQGRLHEKPVYELLSVSGPEHDPEFLVRVLLGDDELSRGTGKSRRTAEKIAARTALRLLRSRASEGEYRDE